MGFAMIYDYKIPEDIKKKIPDAFYLALGGECISIFGIPEILSYDEDGIFLLNYYGSTTGWDRAIKTTCKKLDMQWLYEYYSSLEWYESDLFDDEIVDEVESCFTKGDSNAYYEYLINKER